MAEPASRATCRARCTRSWCRSPGPSPAVPRRAGGGGGGGVAVAEAGDGRRGETSRRRPGTPSGFYQTQKAVAAAAPVEAGATDLGLALNDYLLGRLDLAEHEELYESTRVSVR